jgi:uncharacterized membrane protein HdeD (DUF308 family)
MLARNWWAVALRGVAALLFGLLAIVWPGISLAALVLLFGAYALIDGLFAVVSAIANARGQDRWWIVLLEGIVGIAAGLVTFAWPGLTALALLYLIGAWAVVTGILEIYAAIQLRKMITGEWVLALGGIASVVFGILVFMYPSAGALAIVWWIGVYAIIFGAVMIALGFRLRKWQRPSPSQVSTPRAA